MCQLLWMRETEVLEVKSETHVPIHFISYGMPTQKFNRFKALWNSGFTLYPFANQHVLPAQSNNRNYQGRINCFLYPKRSWRTQTALICVNKCKSLDLRPVNTWQAFQGHCPIHSLLVASPTSAWIWLPLVREAALGSYWYS